MKRRLAALGARVRVHVVTADTFGKARAGLAGLSCRLEILKSGGEDRAKAAYVRRLGRSRVACIGNGRNDRLMLRVAGLGIAVVQAEGASAEALAAADLIATSVDRCAGSVSAAAPPLGIAAQLSTRPGQKCIAQLRVAPAILKSWNSAQNQ